MTEKEFFLNMIRRVLEERVPKEELSNFYYENDNRITIINANLDETIFYFDENGSLSYYE